MLLLPFPESPKKFHQKVSDHGSLDKFIPAVRALDHGTAIGQATAMASPFVIKIILT